MWRCSLNKYQPGDEISRIHSNIVLIYEGDGKNTKGLPMVSKPYLLACDHKSKLRSLLNASALPRAYEFDQGLSVIYAENRDGGRKLVQWN